jgi:hypothetical protein
VVISSRCFNLILIPLRIAGGGVLHRARGVFWFQIVSKWAEDSKGDGVGPELEQWW